MAKKNIVTFLAPSKSLVIAGKHCYAYSGMVASSATPFNLLDFTTGENYIIIKLLVYYGVQGSGSDVQYKIIFNGQTVGQINVPDSNYRTDPPTFRILIPPLTHVEVEQDNLSGGTEPIGASIVGRVYDA